MALLLAGAHVTRGKHRTRNFLLQLLVFLLVVHQVRAATVTVGAQLCNRINGLTPGLREMCQERPNIFVHLSFGIQRAKRECAHAWRAHRWNCSSSSSGANGRSSGAGLGDNDTSFFGRELRVGSRESAFEHALKSAGIYSTIIRDCKLGKLSCGCGGRRRRGNGGGGVSRHPGNRGGPQWGNECGRAQLGFATNYTRKLLNRRAMKINARVMMNRHNYEVGRKMVRQNMREVCVCHGTSGSCTLKACWHKLPRLELIAAKLKRKLQTSSRVRLTRTSTRPRRFKLRAVDSVSQVVRSDDLVWIEKSPDFCERDPKKGTLGTSGRRCYVDDGDDVSDGDAERGTGGAGECSRLCCGRGWDVREVVVSTQCRCKFQWCCHVSCHTCTRTVRHYTCR